jgi:hypothetical protein
MPFVSIVTLVQPSELATDAVPFSKAATVVTERNFVCGHFHLCRLLFLHNFRVDDRTFLFLAALWSAIRFRLGPGWATGLALGRARLF